MDPQLQVEELVAPLRRDLTSGASDVGRAAAEILRRAAVRLPAGSVEELRWGLGEVSRHVLDAQPSMAPLVRLVSSVVLAVESARTLDEARLAAAHVADTFRAQAAERVGEVARHAVEVLPAGGTIATFSSSATVLAALSAEGEARGLRVVCFESRPLSEGRVLASRLAEAGIDVVYAVDAAIHTLLPTCDAALVGADSIGDRGVVNKIGSTVLARAAADAGIPFYVLADETKLLPTGMAQTVADDRPAAEVWEGPAGVEVWNRYFEILPTRWVTGFVTEHGVLGVDELERLRAALEVPVGVRSWAAERASRG